MIRSIRKRHKVIWIALAFLLPSLFVAALALRHEEPRNDGVPAVASEGAR